MTTATAWSTRDLPDLRGRLAVVTGANSGIGFEAARALAQAGADVVLATRSEERGLAAVEAIEAGDPAGTVTRAPLDLARLASVRAFATGRMDDGRPLDILLNNAGVMAVPERQVTEDGFELQLATNVIGHLALTAGLFDLLRASGAARVVFLSSTAARPPARIHLDDLQLEHHYRPWRAYGQSKLAALMLALELHRRSAAGNWGVAAMAVHPGFARTNLQSTGPHLGRSARSFTVTDLANHIPLISQSAAHGALPLLYAAADPGARSGGYYGPDRLFGLVGAPVPAPLPRRARDEAVAHELWDRLSALSGATWPGS